MPRPPSTSGTRTPNRAPGRLWSATALQIAGRVFGSACTAVALFLLARILSPSEFGRFTFWIAAFHLLDALVDCGTGGVAVQHAASDPHSLAGILRAGRRLRGALAALCLPLVAASLLAFEEPGAAWILCAVLYEGTHVLELSATVFRTRIAFGVPVTWRATAAALRLSGVALLASLEITEAGPYILVTAAGSALANLGLHLTARRHLPRLDSQLPTPTARALFRKALPLGLAGLCQQLYFWIDNLFVRALAGETDLGHYNAAVRILAVLILGAQCATVAALPWFARSHAAGELGAAVARFTRPLLAAACFGAGLLWPHAERVLTLLFGAQGGFESAAPSLRWLLVGVAAIHLGAPLMTALLARGDNAGVLRITLCALLVNIGGNALLVPRMSHVGAAASTALTELVVAVGAACLLARAGERVLSRQPLLWLLAAAAFGPGLWLGRLLAGS